MLWLVPMLARWADTDPDKPIYPESPDSSPATPADVHVPGEATHAQWADKTGTSFDDTSAYMRKIKK